MAIRVLRARWTGRSRMAQPEREEGTEAGGIIEGRRGPAIAGPRECGARRLESVRPRAQRPRQTVARIFKSVVFFAFHGLQATRRRGAAGYEANGEPLSAEARRYG